MTRINNISGPIFSSSPPPISGRDATMPPRKLQEPSSNQSTPAASRSILTSITNLPMDGIGPRVLGEALQEGIKNALEE